MSHPNIDPHVWLLRLNHRSTFLLDEHVLSSEKEIEKIKGKIESFVHNKGPNTSIETLTITITLISQHEQATRSPKCIRIG